MNVLINSPEEPLTNILEEPFLQTPKRMRKPSLTSGLDADRPFQLLNRVALHQQAASVQVPNTPLEAGQSLATRFKSASYYPVHTQQQIHAPFDKRDV